MIKTYRVGFYQFLNIKLIVTVPEVCFVDANTLY